MLGLSQHCDSDTRTNLPSIKSCADGSVSLFQTIRGISLSEGGRAWVNLPYLDPQVQLNKVATLLESNRADKAIHVE
jgi:hypothetical protein